MLESGSLGKNSNISMFNLKKVKELIKRYPSRSMTLGLLLVILVAGLVTRLNNNDKNKTISSNPAIAAYQKQLPALAAAVKKNGNDALARQNYAVALYATGDIGKAKAQYEAEVKSNPKDAALRNNLGNVYRDLKDYDKAISAYQKAIDLNSKLINPYINLANLYLYTLNKNDLAIKVTNDAIKNNPDNEDFKILLGMAYIKSGNNVKARESFQNVLDKNPKNAAALDGIKRVK